MTFSDLIAQCSQTAYPEPISMLHTEILGRAIKLFSPFLTNAKTILDIGIGPAQSTIAFRDMGIKPLGISVLAGEVLSARSAGLDAIQMDMHDIGQLTQTFDAVWARHVLEHSPCPALVLCLIFERLNPGGWLYCEVPDPDTDANHQQNANHWAVLTSSSWCELIGRVGFVNLKCYGIPIKFPIEGKDFHDNYHAFIAQRPE